MVLALNACWYGRWSCSHSTSDTICCLAIELEVGVTSVSNTPTLSVLHPTSWCSSLAHYPCHGWHHGVWTQQLIHILMHSYREGREPKQVQEKITYLLMTKSPSPPPLRICTLQVINDWSWECPGTRLWEKLRVHQDQHIDMCVGGVIYNLFLFFLLNKFFYSWMSKKLVSEYKSITY